MVAAGTHRNLMAGRVLAYSCVLCPCRSVCREWHTTFSAPITCNPLGAPLPPACPAPAALLLSYPPLTHRSHTTPRKTELGMDGCIYGESQPRLGSYYGRPRYSHQVGVVTGPEVGCCAADAPGKPHCAMPQLLCNTTHVPAGEALRPLTVTGLLGLSVRLRLEGCCRGLRGDSAAAGRRRAAIQVR